MIRTLLIFFVILFLILLAFLKLSFKTVKPDAFDKPFKVGSRDLRVAIADTLPKQIQGLSVLPEMCEDCGMLFVYSKPRLQNFWMKMKAHPRDAVRLRLETLDQRNAGVRGAAALHVAHQELARAAVAVLE